MANPLLEFVLSLVRDPAAAARYAADPDRAIADAQLTDVTRLDVNSLIPVVSESMSAGVVDDNVWTSGQAVSAFDAFGDELPAQVSSADLAPIGHEVIDTSLPDVPERPAGSDDLIDLLAAPVDPVADAGPDHGLGDWLGDREPLAEINDVNDVNHLNDLDDLTGLPDDGFDAFGQ